MKIKWEKHNIQTNYLANILYEIGYEFYKAINGNRYSFEVRKPLQEEDLFGDKTTYEIYIIDDWDEEELLILTLDDNFKIKYINDYIQDHFVLPKENIIVDNWEFYIVGGVKNE